LLDDGEPWRPRPCQCREHGAEGHVGHVHLKVSSTMPGCIFTANVMWVKSWPMDRGILDPTSLCSL
jgi:hypothetical protein